MVVDDKKQRAMEALKIKPRGGGLSGNVVIRLSKDEDLTKDQSNFSDPNEKNQQKRRSDELLKEPEKIKRRRNATVTTSNTRVLRGKK